MTREKTRYEKHSLVLMDTHEIEPIRLLRAWLKELDLAISKTTKQSLVTNIAHAVESKLGATFLKEDGLDEDVVRFRGATVIVDKAGSLKEIQSGQMTFLPFVSS